MSTFYNLPETGSEVTLVTHLAVREDAHTLYGFASEDERRMFRSLIKISGVGAKLALTILSGISTEALIRCVEEKDVASLTKLPGIGKKTAERLLVELSDRIKDWGHGISPASESSFFTTPPAATAIGDAVLMAVMPSAPWLLWATRHPRQSAWSRPLTPLIWPARRSFALPCSRR